MHLKHLSLALLSCFICFVLSAQPDLGGEDTAVGPLAPPPSSQIIDDDYFKSLLEGKDLYIAVNQRMDLEYDYRLTSDPGEIINYNDLNLHFVLEDFTAFQEYFLYKGYDKKKNLNVVDDDLIIYYYPVVRKYLVGSKSYADNPLHIALIKGEPDPNYTASYNNAVIVTNLYKRALKIPARPTAKSPYLFAESRNLFQQTVPNAIMYLEGVTEGKMRGVYYQQYAQPSAFSVASWSENETSIVLANVAPLSVNEKEKRTLKELREKLYEAHRLLQIDCTNLLTMHTEHEALLSDQEQIWFDWVIKSSAQILSDLKVNIDYLTMLEELPTKETTYAHFIHLSSLLRETTLRMRNLPKESEANQVLDQLTAEYLAKVQAEEVRFNDL